MFFPQKGVREVLRKEVNVRLPKRGFFLFLSIPRFSFVQSGEVRKREGRRTKGGEEKRGTETQEGGWGWGGRRVGEERGREEGKKGKRRGDSNEIGGMR